MSKLGKKIKKLFKCQCCEKRVSVVRGYEVQLKPVNTKIVKKSSRDYIRASAREYRQNRK